MKKFNLLYDSDVEGNKELITNTFYAYNIEETTFLDINDLLIDENQKYYSFIILSFYVEPYLLNFGTLPIPEKTKELMRKHKNVFSVFLSEHESDNENVIRCLENQTKIEDLNSNQIIVINGNEKINDLIKKSNSNIIGHTSNRLPNVAATGMNTFDYVYKDERECLFMCYNRMNKSHRLSLLTLLKHGGILDEVDWTLLRGNELKERYLDVYGNYSSNLFLDVFNNDDIKLYKSDIDFLINYGIKKSKYESDYKIDEPPYFIDFYKSYEMNPYQYSYINLIGETSYHNQNVIHITEKSLIPFHYSQIPLILASRGHNKRLKEKYDFDLFEDVVNLSFDDELDNRKRLQIYFEEVKRLRQNEQTIRHFFKNNKNRFDSNREKIKNILNDKTDYNFFKSLI